MSPKVRSELVKSKWRAGLQKLSALPHTVGMGNLLLAAVFLFNALLLLSLFVLIHYLNIDGITSLLYVGNETWCADDVGGIGQHCFADANLGHVTRMENPWSVPTWNYLPASMIPSALAIGLGDVLGRPSVGIVLYLVVMAFAMTTPAVWAARGRAWWIRILIWAAFGFLSVPALWAIDRGNVVGFAVPFMMLAVVGLARSNMLMASIGIALAAAVKPQFGLAILVFVLLGRWMWLLICAGIAAVVQLVPFLLWPADFPGTIIQALRGMFWFGGSQNHLSVPIPASVSWAKGPYLLWEWFVAPWRGGPNFVEEHQGLVTLVVVGALLVVLFLTRRSTPPGLQVALLFLISALALPTAFTYYYIAVLPLAAGTLRSPEVHASKPMVGDQETFHGILELSAARGIRWPEFLWASFMTVTLAASVSRVVFPKVMDPPLTFLVYMTTDFVTIMWMVAIPGYLVTRALAVRRVRRSASSAVPATLSDPELSAP